MSNPLSELLERSEDRVKATLNMLVESPYFYLRDNEELFYFLRRHRSAFAQFFDVYYGWHLIMDSKCARVYKEKWYNESITESNRDVFDFRSRDECLGFMVLLEYFEHLLEETSMTVTEAENPRFRFGELLRFEQRRFSDLFADDPNESRYTEEYVRSRILRKILPTMERYRLIRRIRPPAGHEVREYDTIFEAMPALYHYNTSRLSQPLDPAESAPPPETDEAVDDGVEAEPGAP